MTLGEKLKECRLEKGLSQEKAAEFLGVSRQAVTKWEADQTIPSSGNLLALSALYGVPLEELAGGSAKGQKDRRIRQANLTRWAIIFQAAALNVCIQPMPPEEYGLAYGVMLSVKLIPLAACSVWMACNLRYEKDLARRRKNARIELLYCLLQAAIAIAAYRAQLQLLGALFLLAVCLGYILFINPNYMGRVLVKQKPRRS